MGGLTRERSRSEQSQGDALCHQCGCGGGGEASIGCGGSDREWYYGLQLLLTVTPCGLITGFMLGPGGTEERWVADALLRWRANPSAPSPALAELRPVVRTDHAKRPAVGPTGPLGPARACYYRGLTRNWERNPLQHE